MSRLKEKFKLPLNYNDIPKNKVYLVREQYIKEQNNLCYYCKENLFKNCPDHITSKYINWDLFPKGFLNNPLHLQHSHFTGFTEGVVHAYCNAYINVDLKAFQKKQE